MKFQSSVDKHIDIVINKKKELEITMDNHWLNLVGFIIGHKCNRPKFIYI